MREQGIPLIDAEIVKKGHFWMDTAKKERGETT